MFFGEEKQAQFGFAAFPSVLLAWVLQKRTRVWINLAHSTAAARLGGLSVDGVRI